MNYGSLSLTRLTLFSAAVIALLITSPQRVQAQSVIPVAPTAKKIVKDVQIIFKGAIKLDENRIRSQMSTRVGQPFTNEAVERDIRALYSTGTVENLDIRAVDVAGGVRVIVEIIGRGGIGEISFLGNTAFDNEKLRKEIEVKVGDPVDDGKLSAAQQKIVTLYEKKGFSDVTASYDVVPSTREGFSSVIFKIDEGARGIIHDIRFEGNTAIKSRVLRGKIKSKEHHVWNLWGKKGKLNNQDLQEDIKNLEQAFQDQGYVYAKVTEIRREPVSAKQMDLVYVINEGAKYDVSGVNLSGNTIFTQDALMAGIKTEPGFPYVGSFVKADEKMIQDYYGSRGYADARVETSILEAGPGQVTVAYHITEGTKSYISKVNISGNSVTKDEVIRRELPFAPGEELNTVKIAAGKSRLENLNYFSMVDIRNTPSIAEGYKDVDINVAEQSTGTVNFGAGFSSIDSITGFIQVTQTNFDISDWKDFRGGGQRFNANLRAGALRRDVSLSWTEPWFMGRELALTVEAFYHNLYYLSNRFNQTNVGASTGLRKRLGEHSYVEGTYTLQQVTIDGIANGSTPFITGEAGNYLQSKIDVNWVHDTRDSVFITRSGHKLEAGALISGLGGDVQVYGMNVGGQQYFNLPGDTILSFEGMFRTVEKWGGSRVPIFERQFLGGANNLRGFNYRHAGPKDATGEPLGGTTSVYATSEFSIPVHITSNSDKSPRVVVFGDIGTVSGAIGATTGDGDIYSDVGLGVRLFLPVGPIRIDYAVPMSKDQYTGSGRFQFNMGYKF
ncbi:outer membrane protein assembly factor BamA [Prosthecobacter sp.]|uniref:outer membrane protein assembly factor BamA n=1 Tax=Prosthecobacter sp. TaxID=1965333 RepID=UPI001DCDE639|nr:outer membrane protein assembly factor BamA [Prosthecobacter sp.]MCB1277189.1 outer membrane protein assembly factor BamA [Prosthecobacter sp.]